MSTQTHLKSSRKKCFTLLEVLIVMILVSTLSTALFSFFKRLLVSKFRIETLWQRRMDIELAMMRMQQVFKEMQEEEALYTHPQLTIKCMRLLDRDPNFCGPIKCHIALINKELWLTTQNAQGFRRDELLLTHVEKFDMLFFDKEWLSEWKEECNHSPKMIKILLSTSDAAEMPFAFFLDDTFAELP